MRVDSEILCRKRTVATETRSRTTRSQRNTLMAPRPYPRRGHERGESYEDPVVPSCRLFGRVTGSLCAEHVTDEQRRVREMAIGASGCRLVRISAGPVLRC